MQTGATTMAANGVFLGRRGFLFGLGAVVAAPAIVKAASLMPVRGQVIASTAWGNNFVGLAKRTADGGWRFIDRINTDGLAGAEPPDIFALMARQLMKLPARSEGRFYVPPEYFFACNTGTAEAMTLQAIQDRNVLLSPIGPKLAPMLASMMPTRTFRGIRIETVG